MTEIARWDGLDLRQCYAYSDSASDLPMLRAVGHPVAVNPDCQARARGATQRLAGRRVQPAHEVGDPAHGVDRRRDGDRGGVVLRRIEVHGPQVRPLRWCRRDQTVAGEPSARYGAPRSECEQLRDWATRVSDRSHSSPSSSSSPPSMKRLRKTARSGPGSGAALTWTVSSTVGTQATGSPGVEDRRRERVDGEQQSDLVDRLLVGEGEPPGDHAVTSWCAAAETRRGRDAAEASRSIIVGIGGSVGIGGGSDRSYGGSVRRAAEHQPGDRRRRPSKRAEHRRETSRSPAVSVARRVVSRRPARTGSTSICAGPGEPGRQVVAGDRQRWAFGDVGHRPADEGEQVPAVAALADLPPAVDLGVEVHVFTGLVRCESTSSRARTDGS